MGLGPRGPPSTDEGVVASDEAKKALNAHVNSDDDTEDDDDDDEDEDEDDDKASGGGGGGNDDDDDEAMSRRIRRARITSLVASKHHSDDLARVLGVIGGMEPYRSHHDLVGLGNHHHSTGDTANDTSHGHPMAPVEGSAAILDLGEDSDDEDGA